MKIHLLLCGLFLSTAAYGQGLKRKVLFLGNSYTHVNNLPAMVAAAAASTGDTLVYDMYAPGGYTFGQHLNDAQGVNKIQAGGWDFVVMQEQSQMPSFPQYSLSESVGLCRKIRQHNPCARPLFYMTWGRKNGDASNCGAWPPVCTYAGMDSLLQMRYLQMAERNHAEVSPVGATWKYIRQQFPGIELYSTDESHPAVAGSYAGACSFYASIFKKNPLSISYNGGLSSADAANIRAAASHVVFDSLANWHFPDLPPIADFGYTATGQSNEIQFVNQSLRADTRLWNFGDGDTSSQASPTHTYLANGSYVVTLTVERCDLGTVYESTMQKTLSFCAHTPTVFPDTIMLCSLNPDTLWTQSYDSYQWFDSQGDSIPNATQRYFIPTQSDHHSVRTRLNGCAELSAPAFVDAYTNFGFYYVQQEAQHPICEGDTVLLILKPVTTSQPSDRELQWFQNGSAIPLSANDSIRITTSGDYHAVVYDTLYCPGSPLFTTAALPVAFQNCTVGIGAKVRELPVSVYPNPVNHTLYIAGANHSTVTIFDPVGKRCWEGQLAVDNTITVRDLAPGYYRLKVKQGENWRWAGFVRQ